MSNCSRLKIIINDYYASLPFAALFSACKVSDSFQLQICFIAITKQAQLLHMNFTSSCYPSPILHAWCLLYL
jgi:hypothetical protein